MTDMIEVKTAALAGEALGWAVGKAEGLDLQLAPPGYNGVPWRVFALYRAAVTERTERFNPWEDWALGGPLVEKRMVSLHCPQSTDDIWAGWVITDKGEFCQAGDNALIAACRAIVAAKLGDTVQVPQELISCPA
ncbi:DUF2591 domain-containing protein [Pseudomonas asiatica]|uniref:DUF2591 domain-containing protein n=1 Tax=Pseudomonas asiatica TaxID=2219225 RepID=UPI00209B557C|nr:DUF2591 domain-containing protein [Pseudomonas asiatica]MCO7536163.1 DUF2591 domain-containing protein [Pseudomonas asiatica]MCO7548685.1 DUF2591 domain-containing protein [Pseudomonas asiatica]MCO7560830.1 DUF2591 domain-containing protein [Pseudomonas asiatica]